MEMTQLTLSSSRHANLVRKPTRKWKEDATLLQRPSPAAWWLQAPAHLPTVDRAMAPAGPFVSSAVGLGRLGSQTPPVRTEHSCVQGLPCNLQSLKMSPKLILQYPVPIFLEGISLLPSSHKGREGLLWFRRRPMLPQSSHWES